MAIVRFSLFCCSGRKFKYGSLFDASCTDIYNLRGIAELLFLLPQLVHLEIKFFEFHPQKLLQRFGSHRCFGTSGVLLILPVFIIGGVLVIRLRC